LCCRRNVLPLLGRPRRSLRLLVPIGGRSLGRRTLLRLISLLRNSAIRSLRLLLPGGLLLHLRLAVRIGLILLISLGILLRVCLICSRSGLIVPVLRRVPLLSYLLRPVRTSVIARVGNPLSSGFCRIISTPESQAVASEYGIHDALATGNSVE
jgi:hypothetical protein